MEGDKPTGCMVIPKYLCLLRPLEDRLNDLSPSDAFYPMLATMVKKSQGYLTEALGIETLIMATILHPAFRVKFFCRQFGETSAEAITAEAMLNSTFKRYQASLPAPTITTTQSKSTKGIDKIYNVYSDDEDVGNVEEELESYLRGSDRMKASDYDMDDPSSALVWWAVSLCILYQICETAV